MNPKLLPIIAAVGVAASLALPAGTGSAGTRADTMVTIKTANGDFSGFVNTPRPRQCAKERKVVVYKQKGTEQDRSVDAKVASDTASLNGDRYEWSTGNTGLTGRFYARVAQTPECRSDTSKTVRATKQ